MARPNSGSPKNASPARNDIADTMVPGEKRIPNIGTAIRGFASANLAVSGGNGGGGEMALESCSHRSAMFPATRWMGSPMRSSFFTLVTLTFFNLAAAAPFSDVLPLDWGSSSPSTKDSTSASTSLSGFSPWPSAAPAARSLKPSDISRAMSSSRSLLVRTGPKGSAGSIPLPVKATVGVSQGGKRRWRKEGSAMRRMRVTTNACATPIAENHARK